MEKNKLFLGISLFSLLITSCGNMMPTDNKYHTIVWLNYDNSLIYKDTKVVDGETPVYKGETPTKPSLGKYDYVFTGWTPNIVPAYIDATYVATFKEEISRNFSDGLIPLLSEDGKTMTYGLYPQTNVNDPDLITNLNALSAPESNGWYLYNNDYFAKVNDIIENSFGNTYYFDNGTKIVSGTTYWFKCEPIVWDVLSNDDGDYYVLSTVSLDAHRYAESSNNYADSEIRSWLNNDFYNTAFALNDSYIQTTTVDNSASTTDSSSNSYVCDNTQDKVFLPSYQDYINSNYGFPTSIDPSDYRCCKNTDWARVRGGLYDGSGNSIYWTRSPSNVSGLVCLVDCDGDLAYGRVHYAETGVRPCLSLRIA